MTTALMDRPQPASSFPQFLKSWRQKRRLSQLDLALTANVSQRHVSFLESGRSQPSRQMILTLSETLDIPLRDRNDMLASAGFAPMFRSRPLDDPQMAQVMKAIRLMLENHAPFPAIAMDRAWNIRLSNAPFDRLCSLLAPDLWDRIGGGQRNLMRLFFHPEGMRPYVLNWQVAAGFVWNRAVREMEALGGDEMKAVLTDLKACVDIESMVVPSQEALLPVLPLELEKDGIRISLFTVIATFGTAQDVTADELRIETLFPADAETEALFRQMAGA